MASLFLLRIGDPLESAEKLGLGVDHFHRDAELAEQGHDPLGLPFLGMSPF